MTKKDQPHLPPIGTPNTITRMYDINRSMSLRFDRTTGQTQPAHSIASQRIFNTAPPTPSTPLLK